MRTSMPDLESNPKYTATPLVSVRNSQRKMRSNIAAFQDFSAKAAWKSLQVYKEEKSDLRKLHKVFVWLISDRRMASLHRKFMHQTGPTDVLTFQHGEIFI